MRIISSLLKASAVAALVFALAWIRLPITASTIRTTLALFVGFSFIFAILSLVVGLPLVTLVERIRIGKWWSYSVIAAVTGALLATVAGRRPMGEVKNPHGGMVFSPLTRNSPGIDSFPASSGEYLGSIVFCAIVGGILGLAFWYFHRRGLHLKSQIER